jgi:hypothetical protein
MVFVISKLYCCPDTALPTFKITLGRWARTPAKITASNAGLIDFESTRIS